MMYCRNCGKQIEDDSVFCKHCGKSVQPVEVVHGNRGVLEWFHGLSKGKQITAILYCLWLLVWILNYLAVNDRDGFIVLCFISTVFVPFIIIGIRHIYKLLRNKKSDSKDSIVQASQNDDDISTPINTNTHSGQQAEIKASKVLLPVVSSELLFIFAKKNGRMQVVNKKLSDNTTEDYCQFISADGTIVKVEFSDKIGALTAQDISSQKYKLAVNKCTDGTYYLDYIDNVIEDSTG